MLLLVGIAVVIYALPRNIPKEQARGAISSPQIMSANAAATSSAPIPQNLQEAKVSKVIDGDTIELESGQRVRYIGIDTPETVDPRKPVQCFGKEASNKNKELVDGKSVLLEKDVSKTDKYGRLLRYVYIDDTFINDYLVREGFAHASTFPPDVKYQDKFLTSQHLAQSESKGLWSSCGSSQTSVSNQITQSPSADCNIKGNISSGGEKIYHMSGQQFYDKTVIDTSKGEKWFCTEEEATGAGWRRSKL